MTKSTITREESVQAVFDLKVGYRLGFADLEILKRVARMALAAMDSKPDCNERQLFCSTDTARMKKVISVSAGSESTPLYRHAQPAPASEPVYQYWCYTTVENSEGDPEEFWFWKDCEKDFYDRWKNAKRTLYKTPQPALVVPPEQHWEELCRQHPDMSIGDAIIRAAWWNHCRAAMLQAYPVCTCPSGDGSLRWPCPVHPGNSPAKSDCCPAQNGVSPAQDGNSPATSDNWQVEAEKLAEMHGMSFVMFRHGEAPQCADPTKVVISFTDKGLGHDTLPAAPQEVIGE